MYYNCCITACLFFLLVFFKNSSLKPDEIASMSTIVLMEVTGNTGRKTWQAGRPGEVYQNREKTGGTRRFGRLHLLIDKSRLTIKQKKKCWKFGSKNLGSYNDFNALMSLKYFCFLILRNLCLLWKKNLGFIFP